MLRDVLHVLWRIAEPERRHRAFLGDGCHSHASSPISPAAALRTTASQRFSLPAHVSSRTYRSAIFGTLWRAVQSLRSASPTPSHPRGAAQFRRFRRKPCFCEACKQLVLHAVHGQVSSFFGNTAWAGAGPYETVPPRFKRYLLPAGSLCNPDMLEVELVAVILHHQAANARLGTLPSGPMVKKHARNVYAHTREEARRS